MYIENGESLVCSFSMELLAKNKPYRVLADESGLHLNTIASVINRVHIPSVDTLLRLGDYLGYKVKLEKVK